MKNSDVLAIIMARAGSKGYPSKCTKRLCGKPVFLYTLEHARAAASVTYRMVTTDIWEMDEYTVDMYHPRPAGLRGSYTTAQDVVLDAVRAWEKENQRPDIIVLLGANVPIRERGIIDKCVCVLRKADYYYTSVQTLSRVDKPHPAYMYRYESGNYAEKILPDVAACARRQDADELYYLDGSCVAFRRQNLDKLFEDNAKTVDPFAYLGSSRGYVKTKNTLEIDSHKDFLLAKALIECGLD